MNFTVRQEREAPLLFPGDCSYLRKLLANGHVVWTEETQLCATHGVAAVPLDLCADRSDLLLQAAAGSGRTLDRIAHVASLPRWDARRNRSSPESRRTKNSYPTRVAKRLLALDSGANCST